MKNPVIAVGMMCLMAGTVAASDGHEEAVPKAQLFAGYSLARESGTNAHGWASSLNFNVSRWLALGVETSGHYEKDHGASITKNSYLFGPRLSKRGGKIVPFVYALAGIERTKGKVEFDDVSISAAENETAVALGGGLDIELSPRWALAFEIDDLLVRSEGSTHGTLRFSAGIVLNIGER
ncbi:MAG: outer membrane beta-barrel protein [Vicinamibacteria bacterium]|nr:outer membrane beta-barrel protein [Vicinamibacteria bacterium]